MSTSRVAMYVVITAVSLLLSVSVYAFPLRRSNLDETRLQLALQRGAGILGMFFFNKIGGHKINLNIRTVF